MKKILYLLLLLPLFTACDPSSGYDYYVENSLPEDIYITHKDGLYIPNINDGKAKLEVGAGKTVFIGYASMLGASNGSDILGTYEPGDVVAVFKVWVGGEAEPVEITTYSSDWRYRLISRKDNKGEYTLLLNQELLDKVKKSAE